QGNELYLRRRVLKAAQSATGMKPGGHKNHALDLLSAQQRHRQLGILPRRAGAFFKFQGGGRNALGQQAEAVFIPIVASGNDDLWGQSFLEQLRGLGWAMEAFPAKEDDGISGRFVISQA